jgi:spermidine synthase
VTMLQKAADTESRTRAVARSPAVGWAMAVFLGSGFCSLVDEVIWVRLLKLTLGNTVYASSVVVSTFMGGLALGALTMGRYADRISKPLRAYALLEVCATVSALCLPFALRLADGGYRFVFSKNAASPTTLLAVQIAVSVCLLIIPTMIMGSTLPLLGRYVTVLGHRAGALVGRLYAINTLGAALGCLSAGFVLIRYFGVMGTLYVAAAINAAVGLAAYVLSFSQDAIFAAASETAHETVSKAAQKTVQSGRRYHVLLAGAFFCGFISIGYELVWMRSIVIPMGGMTYVFSAVLTVYLAGNQIGAWFGSYLAGRVKQPAAWFGAALLALGLSGMLFLPWFTAWLGIKSHVDLWAGRLIGSHGARYMVLYVLHCVGLFVVPSTMMGVGFPLALEGWNASQRSVARTTGAVYGANTLGAVLGGVAAGFLLIPLVGVQDSMMLLGLAGAFLGAVVAYMFVPGAAAWQRAAILAVPTAATVYATAVQPGAFLNEVLYQRGYTLERIIEGKTTTVSVRSRGGNLTMGLDGVYMAGDDEHRCAQKSLGHLGVLLNEKARTALSVGFGSGETSWCLSRHGLHRIDCVEIAQEVAETALSYFAHINLGPDLSRSVNMKYMDAKNYLHLSDAKYDLIINDSNVHNSASSAPLYTKEHFENALRHLNPNGLFITKLHMVGQSKANMSSIFGTFLDVFHSVTIWYPATKPYIFFYLVGSGQKQTFSLRHIENEIAKDDVKGSLAFLNIFGAPDLLKWYLGDEQDIRNYLSTYVTNSDYFPYVEFSTDAPQDYFKDLFATMRRDSIIGHIDAAGYSPEAHARWLGEFRSRHN